ncbi:hypothetical protein [Acinetobacter courvalinii]|uniref:hypothetical protein n=1 Tax=Acinetobacter courvalinii TaxID=280147 RepID=UPI001900D1F9|nr:hypothetical protein [Acinetobacter courvalinii]MBJ9957473.1 hypothetical protein [Acinetobacter courvalinii]
MEIKVQLNRKNCLIWGGIIFLILIPLWIFFPIIFSKVTYYILGNPKEYGDHLGAVGDIYGSLNTFFSSIAFLAVAFTTWLQVNALKETREANKRQLNLAEKNHEEQIKESRNAIFSTKFYALLNYKTDMLEQFKVIKDSKEYRGNEIFGLYYKHFEVLLEHYWVDLDSIDKDIILKELKKFDLLVNSGKEFTGWFSYFLIHTQISELIYNSKIDDEDKKFYRSVLSNSMSMEEQITLFWIAPVTPRVMTKLENTKIFSLFFNRKFIPYAKKFYNKSYFGIKSWGKVFEDTQP